MKNFKKILITFLLFFCFKIILINQNDVKAFEFKCYWQWGVPSYGVKETMDQSKKSLPVNGEGGYDVFKADDFSLIPGRKKVKTRFSFGGLGTVPGELYTNGRLEFTLETGALSGRAFVKYKCDKNSNDIINFKQNKTTKNDSLPKLQKEVSNNKNQINYGMQCDFIFRNSITNVTPDGCKLNIYSYDNPSFSRNGKKIDAKECIKNSDIKDDLNSFNTFVNKEKLKYLTKSKQPKLSYTMLLSEKGNKYKVLLVDTENKEQKSLTEVKKSFNGFLNGKDNEGNQYKVHLGFGEIEIKNKISKSVLSGDCGNVKVNNINDLLKSSNVKPNRIQETKIQNTNTPLDKAKFTCTDLGFTPKTEKHADCVMKLIDK